MAGKNKKKIKDLDDSTKLLRDTTEEYDDTLRSIGQHYGEINSVYKRSEKVLSLVKGEISDILSITGLLNTSNAGLLENIVKSQKGYADITKSIVGNIASLEDSETTYKKISYQIEEQKQLIKDISKELENIDASDEKQILAAEELKKNLIGQNDALDKMKKASDGVKRTFNGINALGNEISSTMFGGWVDKFLSITKISGVTSFGSISEMLDKLKKGPAINAISKVTDSNVPPPTAPVAQPPAAQTPQQGPLQVSTEKLEEQQTKYAEKTADSMQSLSSTALKDERRKGRGKRLTFGKYISKEKAQKIESPDIEKVANEIKDNNSIQIKNSQEVSQAIQNGQSDTNNSLSGVTAAFKESESDKLKIETQKISSKETNVGGTAMDLNKGIGDYFNSTTPPGGAGRIGKIAGKVGLAAMVIGLGKEIASFGDSMNAVIARYITTVGGITGSRATKAIGKFTDEVVSQQGTDYEKFKKSIEDTEDYRKLQFQYTIKANVKERQNLESDYFNYQKDVFFDYYNYQNDIVKQSVDYELGLRRDVLNFQFQQQSANLDAELEKRKTLAGSAMKFIGNYAKVSERALNAIGSSTKAIMDGMKQFGAILGGTTKQQFSLIENAQGLSYSYGASADQVLNISHMFKLLGNTTENVGMKLVEGIKGFVGPTGNVQAVFNEIAEASADIYRLMSATPNEIAKQTLALQKAGVKLSSMLKASDTMVLNYKDSIKAEMSLGAMIGQNVSFNEARARLMAGDMVGGANAIRTALGGIDVNQLNPFAKQELARATGLQMDQIIQLQQTGKIETEEDKQLKQAKLTGKAIADAVLNQDIANAGARLALEQKQRKEMMEFEQAQRLVMLRLEQKQKLEQIPVESAYRFYWDKVYAFKFAKEDMRIDTIGEILTSFLQKGSESGGAATYLKQLEQQQLGPDANVMQNLQTLGVNYQTTSGGQISIPNYQTTPGGQISIPNLQNTTGKNDINPQLQMLGKTVVDLDNTVNQMSISSRDPKYQQWLLGSHDIANKYKGGKTPELAAAEYKQFFYEVFGEQGNVYDSNKIKQEKQSIQIQKTNIDRQVDIAKHIVEEKYKNTREYLIYKRKFNVSVEEEKRANELVSYIDGETKLNEKVIDDLYIGLSKVENSIAFDQHNLLKNQITLLQKQLSEGKITREQYTSKMEELKNSFPSLNIGYVEKTKDIQELQPKSDRLPGLGGGPVPTRPDMFFKSPYLGTNFGISPIQGPAVFTQGPVGTGFPQSNLPNQTAFNTSTSPVEQPQITTKSKQTEINNFSNAESILTTISENIATIRSLIETPTRNNAETISILNKIQSEADARGITMYTIETQQSGILEKIVTRTQNTAAAADIVKTNTTVINQAIIPSFQNMEDIQIEMIKVLQDSRDLLSAISNKEGATTINLDGKAISDNVSTRMQNKQSFVRSNRLAVKL